MEPLQYEERGYLKEPFRLFHLADGRGEYIEYHYHAFHKIIILLAGKAGYAVEGERYELSPGDFVLVGRGSIHRPVVAAGDYYERMILYIAPEYLRSLTAGDCDPSECFRRAQETFQYVYRDENGSRVRPLFQALAETIRQGGYGAALLAQAQFTELMVEVNRVVRGGHRVGAAGGDSKVISLLQYLNLHVPHDAAVPAGDGVFRPRLPDGEAAAAGAAAAGAGLHPGGGRGAGGVSGLFHLLPRLQEAVRAQPLGGCREGARFASNYARFMIYIAENAHIIENESSRCDLWRRSL